MKRTKTTVELVATTKEATPEGPVCPKCGTQAGWSGPTYVPERIRTIKKPFAAWSFRDTQEVVDEHLIYGCLKCGYVRHAACTTQEQGEQDVRTK